MNKIKITVSGPAGSGKTAIRQLIAEMLDRPEVQFEIKADLEVKRTPSQIIAVLYSMDTKGTEIEIVEKTCKYE